MSNQKPCPVDLQPVGKRVEVAPGTTLLEAAQKAGVDIISICGGVGSCGECRVRLIEGALSSINLTEQAELTSPEIQTGLRLACQAEVIGPVKVDIPPESLTTPQRLQIEGQGVEVELDPVIIPVDLQITPPDLMDLRSDVSRLKDTLTKQGYPEIKVSSPLLADLSRQLRQLDWRGRFCLRQNELVAVLPFPEGPDLFRVSPSSLFGLAVDIGTTKLAAYLVNLESGEIAAKAGAMNPQIAYGEDVISRIAYSNEYIHGSQTLQMRLVETLNGLAKELCSTAGIAIHQMVDAVVVGNTVMHHLFAGLPVQQLGVSPYVPSVSDAMELAANSIGLEIARGATVYLPPNIAGYVGADHVAMLLAIGIKRTEDTVVALDIGTNTEISLIYQGRHLSCSCASGPAFEGAHIHDGMRAAPGAIERVRIAGDEVNVKTINHQAATGICGSGILDVVAELLKTELMDQRGSLSGNHPHLRKLNGKVEFVLVSAELSAIGKDIIVTRRDINEIQLAKAAIRTGVEILLQEAGIGAAEIDEFVVAGAFGTYLDLESAIRIGMFPNLPIERFKQVGNAAGAGARQLLVSSKQRQVAEQIAKGVEYIELTTHPDFSNQYVRALMF